jgi:GGDEF domain-containing protein
LLGLLHRSPSASSVSPTRETTNLRVRFGFLIFVLAAAAVEIGSSGRPLLSISIVGVLLIVSLLASFNDALIGGVIGLVGAAYTVVVMRLAGVDPNLDPLVVLVPIAALSAGILAGSSRTHLRQLLQPRPSWEEGVPVYGSLGLLHPTLGEARLREEIERARYAGAPLSILRVRWDFCGYEVNPADRVRASRVAARTIEGETRSIDVVYAYAENDLVAILPETSRSEARAFAERLEDAMRAAIVVTVGMRSRRPLTDFVEATFACVSYRVDGESAESMLKATTTGFDDGDQLVAFGPRQTLIAARAVRRRSTVLAGSPRP